MSIDYMKKFKFKLDPYLKQKQFEEKKKMLELAQTMQKVNPYHVAVEEYASETKRILSEEAQKFRSGHFDPKNYRYVQDYFRSIVRKKQILKDHADELKEVVAQKKNALNQARKSRRSLEILKEHRYAEYKKKIFKEETEELDEFNQKL